MFGKIMVEAWLEDLMTSYNRDSHAQRGGYLAQIHMPGGVFQSLVWWALQSLPDEILVGIDIDGERPTERRWTLILRATRCTTACSKVKAMSSKKPTS